MAKLESDAIPAPIQEGDSGQNCVYIPPGDHCNEAYRLSTYTNHPKGISVRPTNLAMAGLYYTGYRDRVRCFSCGSCVENFMMGDSAFDHRWHRSECLMVIGQETTNIPIQISQLRIMFMQSTGKQRPQLSGNILSRPSLPGEAMDVSEVANDLTRVQIQDENQELILANIVDPHHEQSLRSFNLRKEKHRRKTFTKWPSYPCPNLPPELARDGFFYLGNLDRVQCFSCSGVLRNWAPGDVIREQHLRHFRECRFANGMYGRNIPMTSQERGLAEEEDRARAELRIANENTREPPDPSPEEQRRLASYFPCTDAVNPHMEWLQRRFETFKRWPHNKTRATPQQMVAAGFFYLGSSDRTKCYYCNGGLQNWEYNDEPWAEHAKWFPGCEFVIRRKGVNFVKSLMEMHPNLNRPTVRNAVSYEDFPVALPSSTITGSNWEPTSPVEIIAAAAGSHVVKVGRHSDMDTEVEPKRPRTSSPLLLPAQICCWRPSPSGEENDENKRLATYGPFVNLDPLTSKKLAKDGYYCTGFGDRVKCFSCQSTVENWTKDGGLQAMSHDPDCDVLCNNPLRNIPREVSSFDQFLFDYRSANASTDSVSPENLVHAVTSQRCFETNPKPDSDNDENPPCDDLPGYEGQDDLYELSRGA